MDTDEFSKDQEELTKHNPNYSTLGALPLSEALELLDLYMEEPSSTVGWSRHYDSDNEIITWNLWKIKYSKIYTINVSITICMLQDAHPIVLGNILMRARKELRDA